MSVRSTWLRVALGVRRGGGVGRGPGAMLWKPRTSLKRATNMLCLPGLACSHTFSHPSPGTWRANLNHATKSLGHVGRPSFDVPAALASPSIRVQCRDSRLQQICWNLCRAWERLCIAVALLSLESGVVMCTETVLLSSPVKLRVRESRSCPGRASML
eukprot:842574-Rhodomonas_salina.1